MFAYHIYRENFVGDFILPLNQLEKINPEMGAKAREKYVGREKLKDKLVYDPQNTINLDLGNEKLYWGDVSFFSIHDPVLVKKALRDSGLPADFPWKLFKIPVERFSPRSFVWLYETQSKNLPPEECLTIAQAEKTVDFTRISEQTIEYYRECKAENKRALLYVHVPHLLSPDPVDIRGVEIITVE
jgi:hypothetical protein